MTVAGLVAARRFEEAAALAERLLDALPHRESERAALAWPWGVTAHGAPAPKSLAAEEKALARSRTPQPWRSYWRGVLRRRCALGGHERLLEAAARHAAGRHSWMLIEVGRSRMERRRYEAAAEAFERAAVGPMADWKALFFKAECLAALRREAEAVRALHRAAARAPRERRADALAWKGEVLLWLGRLAAARTSLAKAAKGGAIYADGWLGAALVQSRRPGEALPRLEKALARFPDDLEALFWRGEARRLTGALAGARADFRRVEARWRCPWARVHLALMDGETKLPRGLPAPLRRFSFAALARLPHGDCRSFDAAVRSLRRRNAAVRRS